MAVQPKADLIAQLLDSAKRMREVRTAAELLSRTRAGNEPDPRAIDVNLAQPAPGFRGEPERSDLTAG